MLFRLLVSLLSVAAVHANVIGIDFGGDSFKVAIVQPGSPLDIVTNFQSKRKTPMSISFYREERLFGSDSIALMARKPELTFSKVYKMLGRQAEHPLIKELEDHYFNHQIYTNETSGFTCLAHENTYYTPEELVAMMMQHAKDMTLSFGGKVIKDCVLTVPSHFTYHERRALYTAAEIADLRVLTLIEENTAAALNFGMDRVFDTPTTVVFYNMGSSSVQVTIVTYSSYPSKEGGKNKTVGTFEVIGKSWDNSLGGFNFDVKLAQMMAKRFDEVWNKKKSGAGKTILDNVRAMTRLRVEAVKVKEVLSANGEYPVKIEQLHSETDLITKISRNDFEQECEDLFSRITLPIENALKMANISLQNVNQVELLGGGLRIPKIKKILDSYFKTSNLDIGQHLNGDEAMALGAAFRAANLSTAFKVRKVGIQDINNFGITINLETLENGENTETVETGEVKEKWSKVAEVFPKKLPLSGKIRTVTFPYAEDISCKIEYSVDADLPEGTNPFLVQYNITGISEISKEALSKNASVPKVHLSFGLDSDGVVALVKAEATYELPVIESVSSETEENSANSSTNDSSEKSTTKKDVKKSKDANILRRSLTFSEKESLYPYRWLSSHIEEAKQKLSALQEADDERKRKEAALNELEAYVYKVKNRLQDEEKEFSQISTSEQREEILAVALETQTWLEDESDSKTTLKTFKEKLQNVQKLAEPVFFRLKELTARPEAIEKIQKTLSSIKQKMSTWEEKMPQITKNETEQLLKEISIVELWIETKQEAQLLKESFDTPVFTSSETLKQIKPVTALYERYLRKPKPAPEKKVNKTKVETNKTDTNEKVHIKVDLNETSEEFSQQESSGEKPSEEAEPSTQTNENSEANTDEPATAESEAKEEL